MRKSGVLMHITSLPSRGGVGTLGKAAYDFVDFVKDSGMNIWQMLPVGPTGYAESPYQSASTYAGNPLLIDMKSLETEGLLPDGAFQPLPDSEKVDFEAVRPLVVVIISYVFSSVNLNLLYFYCLWYKIEGRMKNLQQIGLSLARYAHCKLGVCMI